MPNQVAGAQVRLGVSVAELRQSESNVAVLFTDGSAREYDFVVGGDGVHSQLRTMLFGDHLQPRFTGEGVWRYNVPRPPEIDSESDRAEGGIDIELEAQLSTSRMRESGEAPIRIVTTNFKYAYWSFVQMIAHHTSNGCNLQAGDLLGSGTVSGPMDDSRACFMERTEPLQLPHGESRRYLEDGDEVIFKARANREGYVAVGFGECRARIAGASDYVQSCIDPLPI